MVGFNAAYYTHDLQVFDVGSSLNRHWAALLAVNLPWRGDKNLVYNNCVD